MGAALASEQRFEEAIAVLRRAVELDPDSARAHHYLGLACLSLGDRESALRQHEALRALDPARASELLAEIRRRSP